MPEDTDVAEVLKHRIRYAVKPLYEDMVIETLEAFMELHGWEGYFTDHPMAPDMLGQVLNMIEKNGGCAALSEALDCVLGLPHCTGEDAEA